ncbi:MAG: T9SS type A sorting domain-containing protein [Flavobacteriales bacterium]|nr:T9SS type A sorting domain-containing protein [Flavobacteriales bacterium]
MKYKDQLIPSESICPSLNWALPLMACVILSLCPALMNAQGRLFLNNDVRVVIDNGAWLVIQNPAQDAITTMGTGGMIISEAENDRIRWNVGNAAAGNTYVIPYASALGTKIPFTCAVTGSGTGTATSSIVFATYNHTVGAATWDNNSYRPSDVTHMNNWQTGTALTPIATNESRHVVDRFWIVDVNVFGYAFTGNPNLTLGFTYSPTEDIQAGNLIAGIPLGAQRFNSGVNKWGDFAPGVGAWALGTVTNAVVPPGDLFRSWTLSDILNPLPVELIRFDAQCDVDAVTVTWTTASERDNDFFTVERSTDGEQYISLGQVAGAGTSLQVIEYSFVDQAPPSNAFYRLRQTDTNGDEKVSDVRTTSCSGSGETAIINSWDDGLNLNVLVTMAHDQNQVIRLFDASGKMVWEQNTVAFPEGLSTIKIPKSSLNSGIYVVRFDGQNGVMSRRVPLVR